MGNDVLATNGRRTVLLNVLEGCIGCQRLGKLLPCLWTEFVDRKTAKKEAGCQQKCIVMYPGVKNTNDVLATNGRRKVLLNILEGFVGCQHLGKLLSCLWTELVASKTAKKEAGGNVSKN